MLPQRGNAFKFQALKDFAALYHEMKAIHGDNLHEDSWQILASKSLVSPQVMAMTVAKRYAQRGSEESRCGDAKALLAATSYSIPEPWLGPGGILE